MQKIDQFDTATVRDVIRIAATDQRAAEAFLAAMTRMPIAVLHHAAYGPLVSLWAALFLPDPADIKPDAPTGKPLPWNEFYTGIFEQGTGWLHWTPTETWKATVTELEHALKGHIAHQNALNGVSDEMPDAPDTNTPDQRAANVAEGLDPDFNRDALHALKARM